MSEIEKDKIILELQERVNKLEGKNEDGIPTYSFSKISFKELRSLVTINSIYNYDIFKPWFDNNITLKSIDIDFLQELIDENIFLIHKYKEEDLKIKFVTPILNRVKFLNFENNMRDFYNEKLTYKTDDFIFNGETDFLIANGLEYSEKPYFFIQEFKKGKTNSDPEPQLLAELISAVELNDEIVMKGAYIVGAIWNFVVLEKLGQNSYQYFISQNFDSTKIEDLKAIYKNLLFIKNEIIESITLDNIYRKFKKGKNNEKI